MTPEERLAALLDERDEEIDRLNRKIEELEQATENTTAEWALPRIIEDEHPELPLPRLEIVFRPSRYDDGAETWARTVIEYRMVRRHLLGHVEVAPMGRTVRTGSDNPPWAPSVDGAPPRWVVEEGLDPEAWRIGYVLPYRDGAHAVHDAAHLAMPLYVQTERGMERLDHFADISHKGQRVAGSKHRRGHGAVLRDGAVAESLLTALLGLVVRWDTERDVSDAMELLHAGRTMAALQLPAKSHVSDLRTVIHAYFENKPMEPADGAVVAGQIEPYPRHNEAVAQAAHELRMAAQVGVAEGILAGCEADETRDVANDLEASWLSLAAYFASLNTALLGLAVRWKAARANVSGNEFLIAAVLGEHIEDLCAVIDVYFGDKPAEPG